MSGYDTPIRRLSLCGGRQLASLLKEVKFKQSLLGHHTFIPRWLKYQNNIDLIYTLHFCNLNIDILNKNVCHRTYLKSGVMINGVLTATEQGSPQGGNLSPLLSNIYLTVFDLELERRGHKFVRYADDVNIYVKSQRAAERVLSSSRKFLETKLKLK
ncbi:MAG: hypothetical protein II212_04600, partial [Alistipes sp.]|nr:hypothetical protein [Alistipes sp.]